MNPRAPRSTAPAVPRSRLAAQGVLLDTGVLVALYARDDPWHRAASHWLAGFDGHLHTAEAVLTEAAFFLPARQRAALADLAHQGTLQVHQSDAPAHARIAELLRKYADLDPDWADISLVWLAEHSGISRIATLDVADFSAYRIDGRKRFALELLR